jgi:glycerol kinase
MGAAYMAGLAVGYWANVDEIKQNYALDRSWKPEINSTQAKSLIQGWTAAVTRTFGWVKELETK